MFYRITNSLFGVHRTGGYLAAFSMLSIAQLRKIDPSKKNLSDEQLEEIRHAMYEMVQLAYDVWQGDKKGSKNPTGVFPPEEPNDTLSLWDQKH